MLNTADVWICEVWSQRLGGRWVVWKWVLYMHNWLDNRNSIPLWAFEEMSQQKKNGPEIGIANVSLKVKKKIQFFSCLPYEATSSVSCWDQGAVTPALAVGPWWTSVWPLPLSSSALRKSRFVFSHHSGGWESACRRRESGLFWGFTLCLCVCALLCPAQTSSLPHELLLNQLPS